MCHACRVRPTLEKHSVRGRKLTFKKSQRRTEAFRGTWTWYAIGAIRTVMLKSAIARESCKYGFFRQRLRFLSDSNDQSSSCAMADPCRLAMLKAS